MKKGLAFCLAALLTNAAQAAPLVTGGEAGYRKFSVGQRPFTQVSGCWQSPTVSRVAGSGGSSPQMAIWVGINGVTSIDGTLIQAGAIYAVNPTTGVLDYQGFYERLPANIVLLPGGHPIVPGDIICSNITCTSNCTASNAGTTWSTQIDNCKLTPPLVGALTCASPSWTYTRNDTYLSAMRNAEWIIEDLPNGGSNFPYPVYGCVPFTNGLFNSVPAALDVTFENIQMDQTATTGWTANPSSPSSTGDGFSVCWGTGGVQTTTPTGDPAYLPGIGGRIFK